MKTAMQELKAHIQNMVDNGGDMDLLCVIGLMDSKFISEEKQQIVDLCTEAYEIGLGHGKYSAKIYYNKTFNDNV